MLGLHHSFASGDIRFLIYYVIPKDRMNKGSCLFWERAPGSMSHPEKFEDHRHCDSGNLVLLICHMTSRDLMFNWFCYFIDGNPLRSVHLFMFGDH